ncbi:MAG: DNA polymerase [Patescibacteria group bacterium]
MSAKANTKNKNAKRVLVLLDAHAILHRAFHALPSFTSPQGAPTGALYGFSSMLIKIIRELKPDFIAACYDLPQPTFRHAVYEAYKGKRPKMDEGLALQINKSRDILKAFHIPVYDAPGFEADDIIGTIVSKSKKEKNLKVIIASGDMDTLQLVSGSSVTVYTLKKGVQDTIVYDEVGVKERFGFAPALLPDFKGLKGDPSDNIIGVPGIGDKSATELILKFGSLENIYKILKKDRAKFLNSGIKQRIVALLEEYKEDALFSKELATIRLDAPVAFNVKDAEWGKEYDRANAEKLFRELGFASLLTRLPGITEEVKNFYFPADVKKAKKLSVAFWLLDSRHISAPAEDIVKAVNAKNMEEAETALDGKLAEEGLLDFFKNTEVPLMGILDEMERRGILIDRKILTRFSKKYEKEMDGLEKRICQLADVKFNVGSPKQLSEILYDKLKISTKGIKKTGGGARSTSSPELKKLLSAHLIIEPVLKYRELAKLKSTYLDTLPELADKDSRIHTTYNQAGTVTGRFSSQNPNLQNIPIKSETGREIRRAFIVPSGWKMLSADYSQIELRIAAVLSDDQIMKKAFLEGKDIHAATASAVFNVTEAEVTKEMRRRAKIINFGILYGMGARSLAENLGVALDEAKKYLEEYFEDFSGVKKYIDETKDAAKSAGFVKTLFGRKRYFPELRVLPEYLHHEFLRMAVNAPIQGTAADIMKIAMVRVHRALQKDPEMAQNTRMILQIHDELIFEIKDEWVTKAAQIIRREMEGAYKNDIPLTVDINAGANWADMKKV